MRTLPAAARQQLLDRARKLFNEGKDCIALAYRPVYVPAIRKKAGIVE